MWMKSHTSQGGCHVPDYRTEVLILIPDIDRTYGIAMRPKATTATKISTPGLASLSTPGAGGGGTPLFVDDHCAAEGLPFIKDPMSRLPEGPLVELLVDLVAVVQLRPDIAHITNHERLHPAFEEGGDEGSCELVLDVAELIVQPAKLSVFRLLDGTPTPRPLLLRGQPGGERALSLF